MPLTHALSLVLCEEWKDAFSDDYESREWDWSRAPGAAMGGVRDSVRAGVATADTSTLGGGAGDHAGAERKHPGTATAAAAAAAAAVAVARERGAAAAAAAAATRAAAGTVLGTSPMAPVGGEMRGGGSGGGGGMLQRRGESGASVGADDGKSSKDDGSAWCNFEYSYGYAAGAAAEAQARRALLRQEQQRQHRRRLRQRQRKQRRRQRQAHRRNSGEILLDFGPGVSSAMAAGAAGKTDAGGKSDAVR